MWVLLLNDMRSGRIENLKPVVRHETKEGLLNFVESQKVEPYVTVGEHILVHTTDMLAGQIDRSNDYKYHKVFKKDGPLEWYNEPNMHDQDRHFCNVGTEQEWANNAIIEYRNKILSIPSI